MKFGDACQGITFKLNEDPKKGPVIVHTEEVKEWLSFVAVQVYEELKDKEIGADVII